MPGLTANQPQIVRFRDRTTQRWECEQGELVIWFRFADLFARTPTLSVLDTWQTKNGDVITITNQSNDIPPWFAGRDSAMTANPVSRSLQDDEDTLDGPDIWRAFAGDRIVRIAPVRFADGPADGILEIVDFRSCALVFGESRESSSSMFFPRFYSIDSVDRAREAGARVAAMGVPRVVSAPNERWSIG